MKRLALALLASPVAADPVGQALFLDNCAACHGEDGTGVDSEPDIRGQSAAQLKRAFNGMDAMPEFAFEPDEVDALVAYLHILEDQG